MSLMILAPPMPIATLAERELSLPDLAYRYATAIGEPIEVSPAVEHRAVAIYADRRPWEEIIAVASEACGFQIVREREKLRMKSTRSYSTTGLELELNATIKAMLPVPASVREMYEARQEVLHAPTEERRAEILATTESVAAPANLVAARLLAKGVRFPLGRTMVFEDVPLSHADDAVFGADKKIARFTRVRAAFNLTEDRLTGAVDFLDGERFVTTRRNSLDLLPRAKEAANSPSMQLLRSVPWGTSPEPTVRDPAIGDLLEWWHRCTGETTAGPAVRISIGTANYNAISVSSIDMTTSAVDRGFTFSRTKAGIVAHSEWGDGVWPHDFLSLERSKRPNLAAFVRFAGSDRSLWNYLQANPRNGVVIRTMPGAPDLEWNHLRLLGELAPADYLALLSSRRTQFTTRAPATLAAVRRNGMRNGPEIALVSARTSIESLTLAARFRTGNGWRAFDPQGHPWEQWVLTEGESHGESLIRWQGVPIPFGTRQRIDVESVEFSIAASPQEVSDSFLTPVQIVFAVGPVVPITKSTGG